MKSSLCVCSFLLLIGLCCGGVLDNTLGADRVRVQVLYEVLCPDCVKFVYGQLGPTMTQDNHDYLAVAERCAGEHGVDFARIKSCYEEEGDHISAENGKLTKQLAPNLDWTPTILFNGERNKESEFDLKTEVCNAYGEDVPECN